MGVEPKNKSIMDTKNATADYNTAKNYFKYLNPLSDSVKLCLLKMLTDSLVVVPTQIKEKKKTSLSELFGVWADNLEMDNIEDDIKNSRTNGHLRQTVSFD